MNQFISAAIVGVVIVAGGFGGHMMRGSGSDTAKVDEAHGDGHGGDEYTDASGGYDDGHGGGDSYSSSSGDTSFFKFSREFVVPVMRGHQVESLVILNLNLEVEQSVASSLFTQEPKLRDNIMTTLIGLSNEGDTMQAITDVRNYETIRSMVLENLRNDLPNGLVNVLIVDIARQTM